MKNEILNIFGINKNLVFNSNVSENILNAFLKGNDISICDLKNDTDRVLYCLSFINENLSSETCDNYIDNILSFTDIKDYGLFYKVMNSLKERNDKNVRQKI